MTQETLNRCWNILLVVAFIINIVDAITFWRRGELALAATKIGIVLVVAIILLSYNPNR